MLIKIGPKVWIDPDDVQAIDWSSGGHGGCPLVTLRPSGMQARASDFFVAHLPEYNYTTPDEIAQDKIIELIEELGLAPSKIKVKPQPDITVPRML
jgi:hypothetical protein